VYGHLGANHIRKDAAAVAMSDAKDGIWGWAFLALAALNVPLVEKIAPGVKALHKAVVHDSTTKGWGLKTALKVAKNLVKLAYTHRLLSDVPTSVQEQCGVGPSDVLPKPAPAPPPGKPKRTRTGGDAPKKKGDDVDDEDKDEDEDEDVDSETEDEKDTNTTEPTAKKPKNGESEAATEDGQHEAGTGGKPTGEPADNATCKETPLAMGRGATDARSSPGMTTSTRINCML